MTNSEKPKVLIVDDLPTNITVLEGILRDLDLTTMSARSGSEALSLMLDNDFALVLLDVQMPEMDGFETAELMRGSAKTKHIPIIFVTAISKSQEHIFRGYEAGAVDYIFKPFNPNILKGKVNIFLDLYNQKNKLERINDELRDANRRILDQQRSIIEEERLKVLLQLSGATAHELNQPLMGLLGIVDIIKLEKDPNTVMEYVGKIEDATNRISGIVQKIQTIRYDEVIPYSAGVSIINIDQKINILVVEDNDNDFEAINNILMENNNINIKRVNNIENAFSLIKEEPLDLLLLDYYLPDGNAFEMLERMKEEQCEVPAVIITGQGNEVIASKIIQAGAYDYLPRDSLNSNSLSRTIMNTLEKAQLKRQVKEAYNRMVDMSVRDELTGLFNRRYFIDAIEVEVARSQRYKTDLVLCIFDIDHFKRVNDTHGHPTGDKVLAKIGKLLKDSIRDNDIGCRYGGEEFAILLPHTNIEEASVMSERFRELVASYDFAVNALHLNITVSIGVAQYESNKNISSNQLLEQADRALYQAKEGGRNRTIIYSGDID
ncbi:MAG: diguanylate cyclase [Deltaproteobacteria bacterium]|nr:diguanylate cyclase [Deltaproteobacteria bacterium]